MRVDDMVLARGCTCAEKIQKTVYNSEKLTHARNHNRRMYTKIDKTENHTALSGTLEIGHGATIHLYSAA